jgi:hypothetical protein
MVMKTKIGQRDFHIYYWIVGKDAGRRIIMGAYGTYEEADMDGYNNFKDYEIIPLNTRDRSMAREMIRKKVLDETHDIEETFRRFKHLRRDNKQ